MSEKIFNIDTVKLCEIAASNPGYSRYLDSILRVCRKASKYEDFLFDPYGSFEAVLFRVDNPSPSKTIEGLYLKAKIMLCNLNSQLAKDGLEGFIGEFLLNKDARDICLYLLRHVNICFLADGSCYIIK